MGAPAGQVSQAGTVQVRYWASARAAAGVSEESVEVTGTTSVAEVIAAVIEQREPGEQAQLARVLDLCSVLVGDQPTPDRSAEVTPGSTLELLPPFAGG